MSDADALMLAILTDPADDLPRLVYADYLEEHGEPERAEFIRVQCQLSTDDADDARNNRLGTNPLRRRERELLTAKNALAWGPSRVMWDAGLKAPTCSLNFMDSCPAGWVGLEFRRGFVESVRLPLAAFAGGGPCGRCVPDPEPGSLQAVADDPWIRPRRYVRRRSECEFCSGTGRHAGGAADLFAAQPVERVTLTDREPQNSDPNWGWVKRIEDDVDCHAYCLPASLWDLLALSFDTMRTVQFKHAPTRAAAMDALSAACVAWGRGLVKRNPRQTSAFTT